MTDRLNAGHPPILELHNSYCSLTGYKIALDFYREAAWLQWMRHGWNMEDLAFVVRCVKALIKTNERRPASLLFRNLIVDTPRFEEDLAFFRAQSRKPKQTERDRTLMAAGHGQTGEANTARSAADIIAGEKAFEQFRALKGEL